MCLLQLPFGDRETALDEGDNSKLQEAGPGCALLH